MKRVFVGLMILSLLVMGGCGSGAKSTSAKKDSKESKFVEEVKNPEALTKLTPDEEKLYKDFTAKKDQNLLKDISNVTLFKLYVQSFVKQDPKTEYALYIEDEEYRKWSLAEQLLQASYNKEDIQWVSDIDQGNRLYVKKIADKKNERVLYVETSKGTFGFRMLEDKNGTWKMAFLPQDLN